MLAVKDGHFVEFNYVLKSPSGEVLRSNSGFGPLSYIQGQGSSIPQIEQEMIGKKAGDLFQVPVKSDSKILGGYNRFIGQFLYFNVQVVSVRYPTRKELSGDCGSKKSKCSCC